VLTCFSALFALAAIGSADATTPMRPVTFVVDTRMSEGPTENFTELAVDPYKLAQLLAPVSPLTVPEPVAAEAETDSDADALTEAVEAPAMAPATVGPQDLLISNEHSYSATVAVNGTVIGMLGPYTHGAIHNITPGTYTVSFSHSSGYQYTHSVQTSEIDGPIVPGGNGAAIVLPKKADDAKE
jgi:hypothetical protein